MDLPFRLAMAVVAPPFGDGHPQIFRVTGPYGATGAVLSISGRSPKARLHLRDATTGRLREIARGYSNAERPFSLRPSPRPGRFLLVGTESVAGAVIDVGAGSVECIEREVADLQAIREEFGADLRFAYPGQVADR